MTFLEQAKQNAALKLNSYAQNSIKLIAIHSYLHHMTSLQL